MVAAVVTRLTLLLALIVASCTTTPALAAPTYGVNAAGGEFGVGTRYGFDYLYPQPDDVRLIDAMGAQAVRVPVKPERIDASMAQLKASVASIRAADMPVVIDLHDFGYWLASDRGARAALVSRLILAVSTKANTSTIAVELGNEPAGDALGLEHALDTRDDLREMGFRTRFIVPSRGWSGIHDIVGNGSVALFKSRLDPLGNTWLAGHFYADAANSGADQTECVADAATRLDAAIASGVPIAITEAGVYDTKLCRSVLTRIKAKVRAAANIKAVFWWGYSPWFPDTYPLALRRQDGTATRLFWCLAWSEAGVCP